MGDVDRRGNADGIVSGNVIGGGAPAGGELLLAVSGVSKHFGGVRAVEDISLSVRRGGLTSIIGPNGAGKTSLLNIISGFYRPDTRSPSVAGGEKNRAHPPR